MFWNIKILTVLIVHKKSGLMTYSGVVKINNVFGRRKSWKRKKKRLEGVGRGAEWRWQTGRKRRRCEKLKCERCQRGDEEGGFGALPVLLFCPCGFHKHSFSRSLLPGVQPWMKSSLWFMIDRLTYEVECNHPAAVPQVVPLIHSWTLQSKKDLVSK